MLLHSIFNTEECLLCFLAFYEKKKKNLTADLHPLKKDLYLRQQFSYWVEFKTSNNKSAAHLLMSEMQV